MIAISVWSTFANDNIDIKTNNSIIDITSTWYIDKYMDLSVWRWGYTLYKLNLPNDLLVKDHQFSIRMTKENSWHETFYLDKKTEVFNYLVEKIWVNTIKKYIDKWIFNIIWFYNQTWSYSYKDTSKYYFSWTWEKVETEYFDIEDQYVINNNWNDKNIKIVINPFNRQFFTWYINQFEAVWPYPTFSIYDNSLLPQNMFISVHETNEEAYKTNKSMPRSKFYPKIKYTLQKYKIYTSNTIETEKQTETKITSVFIPSYEFEIKIPEWESILELNYLKPYFDKDNEWVTIYWNN